jgi:hypothetical protein
MQSTPTGYVVISGGRAKMSTPELIATFDDFSLHRRDTDMEEFGLKNTASYTVDAPRWYVTFALADDTLELSSGQDILDWHVERATRQIVDAILDNPVVRAEVNRRYVAKKKVLTEVDRLRVQYYDLRQVLQPLKDLLEKEDE